MRPWIKNLLTILRIALGFGLLYYIFSSTPSWSALKSLSSAPWTLLGLSLLPFLGAAVESIRLGLLFKSQETHLSFIDGYRLVAVGTLFNFAIPGGTGGDAVKLYYLASENRGHGVEVATVLLVDRAVALFSMLFLVVGLALLNIDLLAEHWLIQWFVTIAIIGMLALITIASIAFSTRLRDSRLYSAMTKSIPFHYYVNRVFNALYAFRGHKKAMVRAALWSLLGHLVLAGMFLIVAMALFPTGVGLFAPLLALLGMLVNALPITPGGLGVGEAAFDRLFGMVGFVGGATIILAWRVGTIPLCILGAYWYIVGLKKAETILKQAQIS